jgi:hypothetical protein
MAEDEVKVKKTAGVAFSAEQMEVIQSLIVEARNDSSNRRSDAISMYNMRDPKAIESVNVKRYNGMFVIGFKNHQSDPMKKAPKWLQYKADPTRGLFKEPYITLILQADGKTEIEEKEIMLIDYMNDREFFQAKCLEVKVKKDIKQYGYLGQSPDYAPEVDDKGVPVVRSKVLAEVETEIRVFMVELPGFDAPVEFIADVLA